MHPTQLLTLRQQRGLLPGRLRGVVADVLPVHLLYNVADVEQTLSVDHAAVKNPSDDEWLSGLLPDANHAHSICLHQSAVHCRIVAHLSRGRDHNIRHELHVVVLHRLQLHLLQLFVSLGGQRGSARVDGCSERSVSQSLAVLQHLSHSKRSTATSSVGGRGGAGRGEAGRGSGAASG
ncbi:hypothetical protein EYF80_017615 [Liparis tanakae]|uniref:Uncharacterized protein n=1 Tax=Liparis tanakae TaxID=230148 RepID=A0A4Z2I2H3_9TELE|nr:hypothetical protein EYF80_017615 [Liparis tanakae]